MPARLGGMGLLRPISLGTNHDASKTLCGPLVDFIINPKNELEDVRKKQTELKKQIRGEKQTGLLNEANTLYDC